MIKGRSQLIGFLFRVTDVFATACAWLSAYYVRCCTGWVPANGELPPFYLCVRQIPLLVLLSVVAYRSSCGLKTKVPGPVFVKPAPAAPLITPLIVEVFNALLTSIVRVLAPRSNVPPRFTPFAATAEALAMLVVDPKVMLPVRATGL